MRHGKKIIKLGRKSAHRKAMLANMAVSLFEHKRITTTSTKAKALKIFVEPLITKSKNDSVHNRRLCFSKLRNKEQRPSQKIVFDEFISVKGIKAQGNQLTSHKLKQVNILEPLEYSQPVEKPDNEPELINDDRVNDESESGSAQATLF